MSLSSFPRLARQMQRRMVLSSSLLRTAPWTPAKTPTAKIPFSVASFHSTRSLLDEEEFTPKDALMDILSREHAEEMENDSTTMPEELKELQTQLTTEQGWKIVDAPDTGITRMIKTGSNNLKVQISFHCQDTVESMEMPEEDESGEEDYVEPSMPLRFTVLATKAGHTLVFSCLSEEGNSSIQSVALATTDDETAILNNGAVGAEKYQGPEFLELAQDLQESFSSFLESEDGVGINQDVSAFIPMYSDYKEQLQYVKFLEGCQKILS